MAEQERPGWSKFAQEMAAEILGQMFAIPILVTVFVGFVLFPFFWVGRELLNAARRRAKS